MTRMPRRCASSISSAASLDVAVLGEDGEEVADVVAAVAQRRLVEGQQPEAVDAQPLEVVELLGEPSEVAGAVAVGVVEAADQHLVEHGPLVPAGVVAVDWRPSVRPDMEDGGQV